MAAVSDEEALLALGVHHRLHEPLVALLDALRSPEARDVILEQKRDELESINTVLAEARYPKGFRGVRDLARQLVYANEAKDEAVRQLQEQAPELKRLRDMERTVARVLTDFGSPKEGTRGLWWLAIQFEELKERAPSFAEVNEVLIQADVPVGLDGVKALVNYRDWAKGVLSGIDAALTDAGITAKGKTGVEAMVREFQLLAEEVSTAKPKLDVSQRRAPCPLWSTQVPHSEHMWEHSADGWVHCPGFSPSIKPV